MLNTPEENYKNFEIPLENEKFVHTAPTSIKIQNETEKEMHDYISASNFRTYMSRRGVPLSTLTKKDISSNMPDAIRLFKTSDRNKISSPAIIERIDLVEERIKNRDLDTFFINKIHE